MVHAFQLLFIDCNYPRAFVWWIGMHAVMFFFLFKEFYNNTYHKKPKAKVESKNEIKQNGNAVEMKSGKTVNEYYVNGTTDVHHRVKSN